ncbi:hypothetical protein CVT24_002986 [Panaeolus cyanescens]|uniref:TPX2 C-terminal domain-containing protein n=1 Tax=Panaeolus cyanescens TaxID=181874 RepID=A0A409W1P2_9AGAR|nr:hypothetical protein CVT24_002986 [Panaeolus cyanescens]
MSLLHSGDELSLRHLPDVSDASFSFQIPGAISAENLLADDDDFFRGGVDVSLETIASPRKANDLLTLSQLTPRPPRNIMSQEVFPICSSSTGASYQSAIAPQDPEFVEQLSHQPNPSPSLISTPPGPSSPAQKLPQVAESQVQQEVTHYRKEGTSRLVKRSDLPIRTAKNKEKNAEEPAQLQKREERRQRLATKVRTRTAITESNITGRSRASLEASPKSNAVPSSVVAATLPTSHLPESSTSPERDSFSGLDASLQSVEPSDSAAERLIKFGKKIASSFSSFPSNNPPVRSLSAIRDVQNVREPPIIDTGTNERDAPFEFKATNVPDDGPLTISQLSPRKCSNPAAAPTPPGNMPESPLRSSSKRPVSENLDDSQGREKRIKTGTVSAASTASSSTDTQMGRPRTRSTTRQAPKAGLSRSDTASQTRVATRLLRTKRSVSATVPPQNSQASASTSRTNDAGPSRATTSSFNRTNNPDSQSTSRRHKPSSSVTRTRLISSESKPAWIDANRSHPSTNTTQHVVRSDKQPQSQSQSEMPSRSLSRTSHSRSQRRYETVHPVPDFKALHAAHEASLANRKENIHPTKPIEIMWETEIRAKERQRFDEMVKEKEKEQERLKEQERKEREEQEAREIRELRKKAIPKANEVPEWYKDVPRKKDKGVSLDASGASSIRR